VLGRLPGTDRFADSSRYPETEAIPTGGGAAGEAGLFYFNAENVKNEVLQRIVDTVP